MADILKSVAFCCGGCLAVLGTHLTKKKKLVENCTAGYIFGLLDSRTPKPNLSNRGTTLLLLMLQRGTKTKVIDLLVLVRIRMTLA